MNIMMNLFKATEQSIQVDGEFPTVGSLYVWSEPTGTSSGLVKEVSSTKILLSPFKESSEDKETIIELTLVKNSIFIIILKDSIQEYKPSEWSSEYVKKYLTFYNSPEDKKKLLEEMIDYKDKVVIPKLQMKLEFVNSEKNYFTNLLNELG